jgi:thiamine pyrophosphokinase
VKDDLHFVHADRLDRLIEHDLVLGDLDSVLGERSARSRAETEP